ncbi:MAG: TonB-dependent receptor [Polymorphobacter sp.]
MHTRTLVATLLLCAAMPAFAEGDDGDLSLIIITGVSAGYTGLDTSTATGIATALVDVPQSISVLTRSQLDDQSLLTLGAALRWVPGVSVGQGEGHRDQVTIRGNNSTADFFVDGLRDDAQYFRDLYNAERVEVLKGPNAMTFGRGGGGGVVNRVTKVPGHQPLFAVDAVVDSFGSLRFSGDINQPLGTSVAVRLNGFYQDAQTFRDGSDINRFGINPTVLVALGDKASLGLGYEYADDDSSVDRGVPSQGGRPIKGYDRTLFGVATVNQSTLEANLLSGWFSYAFTDTLSLRARALYATYDKGYTNLYAATAVAVGGSSVGIDAYRDLADRSNLLSQTDLIWQTGTDRVRHTLLAGIETTNQDSHSQRINGFFSPVANITRAVVALAPVLNIPPVYFRAGPGNRESETTANGFALYGQDQIGIGDHFEILAGLRFDRFTLDFTNLVSAATLSRTDEFWSPRLGLVYKPVAQASVYASFSRSYLPQSGDQFNSLDATTAALAPERFDNYEIGAKWDIRPALSLTAALYRLDRTNTRAVGPVAGTVVLTGAQRSQGLELGLSGAITAQWQASLGYTLQDVEIRSTTTAAPAGRKAALAPRHQAFAWSRYNLSPAFGFGLGVSYQSDSFASVSNAVVLPAYARVDAALYASIGFGIEAQLNIENLFDSGYFATAHNDNNITPGGPVAARFTLSKRF